MSKRPAKRRKPKSAPAAPQSFSPAEVDAAVAARDAAAAGSPGIVRRALLGNTPIPVGELTVMPVTIGTHLMLEQIASPIGGYDGKSPDEEGRIALTTVDVLAAAFIMSNPAGARAALSVSRQAFDKEVALLADKIPFHDFPILTDAIVRQITSASEPAPQGDGRANPSAPLTGTPASVGG